MKLKNAPRWIFQKSHEVYSSFSPLQAAELPIPAIFIRDILKLQKNPQQTSQKRTYLGESLLAPG